MNIIKFPDKFEGDDDFQRTISEYHRLLWRIIPFVWFIILGITFLFYSQKEIVRLVFGILGATLTALGTPMQPKQIVELSESNWDFNTAIAKAYLQNMLFVAIGLFLVILTLVL
jgi:hypothetical protein